MFALVDVNNMYCSVERVFDPRLEGRPLVVLSSNDGACIARSNEAKDLGVQMAQPWFQVRHLQKTHGLIALSANFELYSDMSARMMAIASRYSPNVVPYSIDEAFIDFHGIHGDLTAQSRHLRTTVLQELGLPTSVGIAPTKTLAKLANHIAKTCDRKPGHYPQALSHRLAQVCNTTDLTATELEALMSATDVGDVWGVGRKIAAKLHAGGVRTVLDLMRADMATLRRQFSVVFEKTVLELRGTPCMEVEEAPAAKQQILVSRSFGKPVTQVDGIVEAVSEFASRASEKLRLQGSVAGALQVFIRTSPFREGDRQHSPSMTVPMRPTADSRKIVQAACDAARSMFRPGFNYAKAGVMLMDLREAQAIGDQGELDLGGSDGGESAPEPDRPALMAAMDELNRRFGRGAVRVGSTASALAADSGGASWSVRQDRRTPRYTTRWEELPVVRA
ncbi:MAG: Y-family DNA polymerase [Betaproteobacteria bacterium]|uniref:Y-family DNA polymerase n=1 Tax=Silanimonas sp. TaxID=1929290 RepID=UPI0022C27136|nr:Y-family DNA polymerase [Silanimonas sp.]MCZ8167054.1 Y-family DNA polymerase [Silanimonas sp.]